MNKEEMISEIEIYLSHVIAKDFPLPKAIRLMYEEYKNSNKAWEKIYDEDQNYIGELNNKIFDLKCEVKNLQKKIEELNKSDASKEQSSMNYYNLYKELEDKIKAKIEEIKKGKENIYFEEHLESILQSLLEKED